jgi:hypothetical protein
LLLLGCCSIHLWLLLLLLLLLLLRGRLLLLTALLMLLSLLLIKLHQLFNTEGETTYIQPQKNCTYITPW